ncbi:hypothetical protein Sste5346_009080 [Sporothrix stenoceras]|uniref:Uncharacterized protein n=1 Tax=Sporothrix stenoceras TaxID=5173 RepID=A0ABR3YLB8_9PEZI
MAAAHINVNYAGRYTIDWVPDGSPVDHPSPALRTSPRYIDFISRSLEEVRINKKGLSPATQAEQIRLIRAVLDRAKDPQGRIAGVVVREDDNSISSPEEEDGMEVRFGGLCDFRRTPHPKSPAQHQHEPEHVCSVLQHGDVYELVTDDPDSHPLPSERLLKVQYGLHQIMSDMRAAGGLRDVFRGTPPPDEDGANPCPSIPTLWQDLIQEAQDLGILTEDAAARWGRAFARQALQDSEDAADYVRRIVGDDSFSDHSQEDDGNDNDQDRFGIGKSVEDQEHGLR